MLQFFSYIVRFLQQKHIKSFLIIGGLILVGFCFGEDTSGTSEYTESDLSKNIIQIFDLLFGLLALVLGPMVVLAGWLLSPDWTMGDFFGLRSYFQHVWVFVANVVYVIFALMLLYMAIMQIFGGPKSEYAFKSRLSKFLIGILIVPFTWLIVSWTLSFANQAVAAVLSIPMGSIKFDTGVNGQQDTSMWHKKMLPTEFDFSTKSSGYGKMTCENGTLKSNAGVRCMSPAEFLTYNQSGPFFIIMIYAYNIFKIQDADLQNLKKDFCKDTSADGSAKKETAKNCVQSLVAIVRDFGLSLIVTVFFAVMLIALCWVLLMRAIKLWIYIMLSPLFGLAYFTDKGFGESIGEAGESGFGQVGFMSFFKLAMVPVLVSAVLAFGLLFVGVVRDNFHPVANTGQKQVCTERNAGYMVVYCIEEITANNTTSYESKLIIGNGAKNKNGQSTDITLNFGDDFSNIISGAESEGILSTAAGAVEGGISSVEDIFAHLILTMMALVFMFMGVKVAVQYDAVTKAAFEPFRKLGDSVGTFIAHSPSYLPLPHPAFAAITNPSALANTVDMAVRTKINQSNAIAGKSLADMMGGQRQAFEESFSKFQAGTGTFNDAVSNFLRTSEKNPEQAKEMVLAAIDKLPVNRRNAPGVIRFKDAVSRTRDAEGLSSAFEDNSAIVDEIERNQDTGGIKRLGDGLGATASSASRPFQYATTATGGNISNGSTRVVTTASDGRVTVQLDPAEKTHIQRILSRTTVINPSDDATNNRYLQSIFPQMNSDEISRMPPAQKKAILDKIKDEAYR